VSFFGSTAGEGGWRVAIVDSVDELNDSGANALLKVLEEPPRRALLLLVSNSPGRVLPTIRSRCRVLMLRPLSPPDTALAAARALDRGANEPELRAAAEAADGSTARALTLLEGPALALRQRVLDLIGQLPNPDRRALHALGDAIAGTEPQTLAAFLDTVQAWLAGQISRGPQDSGRLARAAAAWEKINSAGHDAQDYNLERKPLVFAVFGWLAEAVRD
jgi:DNA polymerase-3 subunit delta'